LATSRREVERISGAPALSLAYPFGDYDATTVEIVSRLGFDHAVSVLAGPANDWRQRFFLPRLDVKEWTEGEFDRALAWHA
jgi:peptidoglycan/xylan/chitin deacetylase (PgdA/CDA1 family)